MGSNAMFIHLVARRAVVAFLFVLLAASKASAQFDFVGSWAPLATEDVQNDSVPVDYLGLALTDEARTRALSYDESQKSMIERQCFGWGAAYVVLGPFGRTTQKDPSLRRLFRRAPIFIRSLVVIAANVSRNKSVVLTPASWRAMSGA